MKLLQCLLDAIVHRLGRHFKHFGDFFIRMIMKPMQNKSFFKLRRQPINGRMNQPKQFTGLETIYFRGESICKLQSILRLRTPVGRMLLNTRKTTKMDSTVKISLQTGMHQKRFTILPHPQQHVLGDFLYVFKAYKLKSMTTKRARFK